MIVRWEGSRALADRDALAELYGVSPRTIRRHCRPARHEPRTGLPRGLGGLALYDALAAADDLATVVPRPARTAVAQRIEASRPAT